MTTSAKPGAYQCGGPVSLTYIERSSDRVALNRLRRMEYVSLIEPRYQGKSSLISALKAKLEDEGYQFLTVKLTCSAGWTETDWYQAFGRSLLSQLPREPTRDAIALGSLRMPNDWHSWEQLLTELGAQASQQQVNLIIALDDVGTTPTEWATRFFSVIRSVYDGEGKNFGSGISFLISGAFNAENLIQDAAISNFNISHRVELPDFTLPEVRQFLQWLPVKPVEPEALAQRIYHWTDGQPYLVQYLYRAIADQQVDATPDGVDHVAQKLHQWDFKHVTPLVDTLGRQPMSTITYVKNLLNNALVKFWPAETPIQAELALLGLIKADHHDWCIIRNRIYESAIRQSLDFTATGPLPSGPSSHQADDEPNKAGSTYHIYMQGAQGAAIGDGARVTQHFEGDSQRAAEMRRSRPDGAVPETGAPAPAPRAEALPPGLLRRLRDVAKHITEDYVLLRQYEEAYRLETDPKLMLKEQRIIEQIRLSVQQYQLEYTNLRARLASGSSQELQAMQSQLDEIDTLLTSF